MKDSSQKKSLLSKWKESDKKKSLTSSIPSAPLDAVIPASHGQQRLWFLQQLYPRNPVYNYSDLYTFKGDLQPEILKLSLHKIFANNRVLRAFFVLENGMLVQKTSPVSSLKIKEFDLSQLTESERDEQKQKILAEDAGSGFDLDKAPLMRVSLIKVAASEWDLLVTIHHIITDKWSMGLFREQMAKHYKNLISDVPLAVEAPPIQFSDFAYWQQSQEVDPEQLQYWKEKLSGELPTLNLPTDYAFTGSTAFKGEPLRQPFSKSQSERILNLSKELGTTPYVLLMSVYHLMLHKYSGQKDILLGAPIALRKGKILENLIGFFDETIVLRTIFSHEDTFLDLVKKVNQTVLEAFSNRDVPFDLLVKELKPERIPGKTPFFRGMFMYHDIPETPSFGPGVEMTYVLLNSGVSKFDLTMFISNENDLLSSSFEYSKELFEEETILRFHENYRTLLEHILDNPNEKICNISMLNERELAILMPGKVVNEGPFSNYNGIHEIITEIGNQYPDNAAVTFNDQSISYRQLLQRSDIIAKNIISQTEGRNEIVGLCTERSIEMIVGILAILKAGCAYLPIDPEYPEERINYMLADSKVPLVFTQDKLAALFNTYEGAVHLIDGQVDSEVNDPVSLPVASGDDLAYVIYTSGSSGQPKGVPISHKNIILSTEGRLTFYPNHPKAFLLLSSISFDSSKAGIFWSLCTGGNLVIAEKRLEQDITKLEEVIYRNSVTHTLMLPSLYKTILDHSDISKLGSLNTVAVAGEACGISTVVAHFKKLPGVALYNEYGPTEATVWCIAHQITEDQNRNTPIPIGKAVGHAEIYILNEELQLVPVGAVGEIYIGGALLTSGYLNNSERTAKSFINHPFDKDASKKLYKTGDLGRYNTYGQIEFLGRADQQIKIRGFRVELGEIEKTVEGNADVDKVVVLLEESAREEVGEHISELDTDSIVEYLENFNDQTQIEELIASIQALTDDEKKYLLKQLQE
ncbi:non-ribosomal peptide synthetase [Muriicola sp. Z0-33]|uniref:non-ribosomal peptide synthetase n=1 Tax=Muriicola sp. Z0-33 TaxID=2816957 RepID=UPI002238E8AF|nr:amino acid adenylation domain-containing protein [Muriicola sp. Z0-33]MCW5515230.1 amino acid adenylation domain-containing protein [Muriicola sp. Z0-33]